LYLGYSPYSNTWGGGRKNIQAIEIMGAFDVNESFSEFNGVETEAVWDLSW